MPQQSRWLCHGCQREWVFAYAWEDGSDCPACHSPQIERVMYTPQFPGADIRTQSDELPCPPSDIPTQSVPQPSEAHLRIVRQRVDSECDDVSVTSNHLLAQSSPEFG